MKPLWQLKSFKFNKHNFGLFHDHIKIDMAKIKVRKGESLEQALRRFSKITLPIVREARERDRYIKPSEMKKIKRKELARKIYLEKKRKRR